MSLRDKFPKARVVDTHYSLSLTRGEHARSLRIRPGMLYTLLGLLPLLGAWYLGATFYFIFRDDMLASLMTRQAEMQYSYEDRLAAMRAQVDRVTSRQLLDQDTFEGKVHDLISRQAQLESRNMIVATLADQAGVSRETTGTIPRLGEAGPARIGKTLAPPVLAGAGKNPLLNGKAAAPALPAGASAFAPSETSRPFNNAPGDNKPRPDGFDLRTENEAGIRLHTSLDPVLADPDAPLPSRLGVIAGSLDRIERDQVQTLARLERPAIAAVSRIRTALSEVGLSADTMKAPQAKAPANTAQGGPFIPLKVDPNGSPFEREVSRLQSTIIAVDRLRRVIKYVPLKKPLNGEADITSGFGGRADPFFGRAAMHSGIDFRQEYGSPIKATAAGRVITAGMNGGYGNMVEIDHGNGITTRYAHMSAVNVEEGDSVEAGAVVGRLGSTGRSTGAHLHYEVRIDGDAVDPARFLRAGRALNGG